MVPDAEMVPADAAVGADYAEDLFGDQGVMKAQLEAGEGHKLPRDGDEVKVTVCTTALDGTPIEEHHEVEYVIGSGTFRSLSRAVDKALSGMKRGEKVSLRCSKEYAYGDDRQEGAKIEVRLAELYETRDVSFCKDGSILKKQVQEGSGYHTPREGANVILAVSLATDGSAPLVSFQAATLEFVAGNGDVCDALECVTMDMKLGEKALVSARGHLCADARLGLQDVVSEFVVLTVEMRHFEKKDTWMSEEDKIAFASSRKDVGNALLKAGRLHMALQRYEKVTEMFSFVDNFEKENESKAVALRQACEANKAAVYLKLAAWQEAEASCNLVLRDDKQNVKVLYRRAQALLNMKRFDDCVADCKKIAEVDPQNKEVRTLLKQAQTGQKQDDKKAQGVFANMCKALGSKPSAEASAVAGEGGHDGDIDMTDAKAAA